MLFCRSSGQIPTISFIILVWISELWDAWFIFKLWISFSILAKSNSSKANLIRFLHLLWIARMLGWSLYFRIALKGGSFTLFITGSKVEYCLISRFFNIFPKKIFKTSVSKFVFKISLFSTKLMCSLTHDLSKSEGFITYQKSLLSDTCFSSKSA